MTVCKEILKMYCIAQSNAAIHLTQLTSTCSKSTTETLGNPNPIPDCFQKILCNDIFSRESFALKFLAIAKHVRYFAQFGTVCKI